MRICVAAFLCALLPATAEAEMLPSCAPPVEVSNIRVMRVERNGVLVLEDGRAASIEGLMLPGGAKDHAPQFLADEAIGALGAIVRGRIVTLAAQRPKEDRYGRLRAQVFITDGTKVWLQSELLRRGLARVSIAPDRRECAGALYAIEDRARRKGAGIWSKAAYFVRHASDTFVADADTFQIVEGTILSANVRNGRGYLDFGSDWRHDFTVTISPADIKTFRQVGVDPESYEGKTVRVRGWIERMRRPEIAIATPDDIEVLDRQ